MPAMPPQAATCANDGRLNRPAKLPVAAHPRKTFVSRSVTGHRHKPRAMGATCSYSAEVCRAVDRHRAPLQVALCHDERVLEAPYLRPFVVDTEPVSPKRVADVDVYLPCVGSRAPLVVLVHGGPMRTAPELPASRWPVYRGYAGLMSALGLAVAMFDHGLLSGQEDRAPVHLRTAIATARSIDGVDGSRVLLWFFSGGGVLSPPYLREAPDWLRGVAFSYPRLDDADPDWDPRAALHPSLRLPMLLTRVGLENPGLVAGQRRFVDEASRLAVPLDIIDVPNGRHAFDCGEPTHESQMAVTRAAHWALATLREPST